MERKGSGKEPNAIELKGMGLDVTRAGGEQRRGGQSGSGNELACADQEERRRGRSGTRTEMMGTGVEWIGDELTGVARKRCRARRVAAPYLEGLNGALCNLYV